MDSVRPPLLGFLGAGPPFGGLGAFRLEARGALSSTGEGEGGAAGAVVLLSGLTDGGGESSETAGEGFEGVAGIRRDSVG